MKAVILVAGAGRRLHPLTLDSPKSLLPIGDSTVLEHMITKLLRADIRSFVVICGFMEEMIRAYIGERFPDLDVTYLTNEHYLTTNTGCSLLVASDQLRDVAFIKLDGDVIFDDEVLERLLALEEGPSYVCVDSSDIGEEVIKVICNERGDVVRIGNGLAVDQAIGESIGIERISRRTSSALFERLEAMMVDPANHQNYYEVAYDEIVRGGAHFKVLDITGLHWVEMDDLADHHQAQAYFGLVELSG